MHYIDYPGGATALPEGAEGAHLCRSGSPKSLEEQARVPAALAVEAQVVVVRQAVGQGLDLVANSRMHNQWYRMDLPEQEHTQLGLVSVAAGAGALDSAQHWSQRRTTPVGIQILEKHTRSMGSVVYDLARALVVLGSANGREPAAAHGRLKHPAQVLHTRKVPDRILACPRACTAAAAAAPCTQDRQVRRDGKCFGGEQQMRTEVARAVRVSSEGCPAVVLDALGPHAVTAGSKTR